MQANKAVKMSKDRNNDWQYDEDNRTYKKHQKRKRDDRNKRRQDKRNYE